MAKRRKVNNLLGLALLALLMPGRPMHPYQMASLLRQTGKDSDVKIKWGSLYTVVQNLEKNGFIESTSSDRDGKRPERTLYAITDAGRDETRDWLRELIANPEPEFPRFATALSVAGVLPPDEVMSLLTRRVEALESSIKAQQLVLTTAAAVPRVFLIEAEYALAMTVAELAWVRSLVTEIEDGTLDGVAGWRSYHETGVVPPEFDAMLEAGG